MLLLGGVAYLCLTRVQFSASLYKRLPVDLPEMRGMDWLNRFFSSDGQFIVTVSSPDPELSVKTAQAFGKRLRLESGLIALVHQEIPLVLMIAWQEMEHALRGRENSIPMVVTGDSMESLLENLSALKARLEMSVQKGSLESFMLPFASPSITAGPTAQTKKACKSNFLSVNVLGKILPNGNSFLIATSRQSEEQGPISMSTTIRGKMSTFGGPEDMGVKPDEHPALVFNRATFAPVPEYFLPQQPPGTTGYARRLNPDTSYVACRWNYAVTPKSYLLGAMARVTNPRTRKHAEAKPIDGGPHGDTGRTADLSPGLAKRLWLKTDDVCEVEIPHPGENGFVEHAREASAPAEGRLTVLSDAAIRAEFGNFSWKDSRTIKEGQSSSPRPGPRRTS